MNYFFILRRAFLLIKKRDGIGSIRTPWKISSSGAFSFLTNNSANILNAHFLIQIHFLHFVLGVQPFFVLEGQMSAERYTAGLSVRNTYTKNQFPNKPKGLRQIWDHGWKARGKENLNIYVSVLYNHFLASYLLKYVKSGSQQTWKRKNQIHFIKRSSTEVSFKLIARIYVLVDILSLY